jgi:hypothetical protein
MRRRGRPPLLLSAEFPALAAEITERLKARAQDQLAATVPELHVIDRCRCGDDFCATMYTEPPPRSAYGAGHRCIDLDADEGMVVLDVVHERIACVEVLYRDDVRRKLVELLP